MDRLSALDAEFLHLEDGAVHMAIAGACVFADPPPTIGEMEALMASKMHLIPRYRQRVRTVPFELGRPVWVDDPDFDLGYHMRHTALPAPGDDGDFCRLMGRLMSQDLDRDRPPWEIWLVEGLEGGRWALVFKVHHCMVDGIAGVGLLTAVLDFVPDAALGEPVPWTPAAEPPGAAKVLDAWGGLAGEVLRAAGSFPGSVVHPVRTFRSLAAVATGAVRFTERLAPTRSLSIEGPVGPHRVWAHSSAPLDEVKTIRTAFGGTVNDVVLAAVAGGYRALLVEREDDVTTAVVRSLVPVSTRTVDAKGVADNRVSALLYELPVGLDDPVERLESVKAQMADLKSSGIAEAGQVMTTVSDLVPPMVLGLVSRTAIRSMHRFGQQSLNTVTTNVPGPQVPLYCLGHLMEEYRPYVPISHGLRVGTAILSYNGRLFFGVTGDFRSTPDVGVLAEATAAGIDDLYERALESLGDHRPA
ncbi:MAG TPA: wax ester/triacylglycerol synthase family O-acyltransferase [Acidimicrobiales bacterium]